MAVVTTPVEGFRGTIAGVEFVDGKGETDHEGALAYFARHGYTVDLGEPVVVIPEGVPSEDWKVDQLLAYAEENSIDLGDAKKKADIVAVLTAPPATDGEGDNADDA